MRKLNSSFASYCALVAILFGYVWWSSQKHNNPSAPPVQFSEPSYTVELMPVRAYCPCEECCGRWADGHTAWQNYKIQPGDKFVAVNPSFIPFGSRVTVPGYNNNQPVLARDRSGGGVEVFFHTHEEALAWGKQELEVKIWR